MGIAWTHVASSSTSDSSASENSTSSSTRSSGNRGGVGGEDGPSSLTGKQRISLLSPNLARAPIPPWFVAHLRKESRQETRRRPRCPRRSRFRRPRSPRCPAGDRAARSARPGAPAPRQRPPTRLKTLPPPVPLRPRVLPLPLSTAGRAPPALPPERSPGLAHHPPRQQEMAEWETTAKDSHVLRGDEAATGRPERRDRVG